MHIAAAHMVVEGACMPWVARMTLDHNRSHWASAAEARNIVVVAGVVVGVVVVDGIQTVVDMTAFVEGSCTAWQHF